MRLRWGEAAPELGKGPGRGVWLCAGSAACFDRAVSSGRLERALRRPIPTQTLERLRERLFG